MGESVVSTAIAIESRVGVVSDPFEQIGYQLPHPIPLQRRAEESQHAQVLRRRRCVVAPRTIGLDEVLGEDVVQTVQERCRQRQQVPVPNFYLRCSLQLK